jgi:hypothetical protein
MVDLLGSFDAVTAMTIGAGSDRHCAVVDSGAMRWTTVLIAHPWLALLPAALLAALWWRSRARTTFVAAALWIAYLGWEIAVSEDRTDANIRIDLLLIYPLLFIVTLAGLWAGRKTRGSN